MQNPLDGIIPNFSIFGVEFTEAWQKILAGVWGLAIIGAIIFLILNLVKIASSSASRNPGELAVARTSAIWAAIALALLASLAVIVGAILAFAQS